MKTFNVTSYDYFVDKDGETKPAINIIIEAEEAVYDEGLVLFQIEDEEGFNRVVALFSDKHVWFKEMKTDE